jgi:hypothetical protein
MLLRYLPLSKQVVVDAFDPSVLVSDCATRVFDFSTMKEEELHDIHMPLDLLVGKHHH